MTSASSVPPRLPVTRKLGYALGIHGIMYFWYATNLYLFYFYTDVVGLTPAQTGTIFLISLIWDGLTDPVMGVITDRLVARGIPYRAMMLAGGLPFSLSFALLFHVPDWAEPYTYCLIANLAFRLFWTLTYIPYTSMLTRITKDSRERASIGGYKTIFIGLAKLPVSFFVLSLVALLGAGNEAVGFERTMSIVAVAGALAFLGCAAFSPRERRASAGAAHPGLNSAEIARFFRKNSQFWIILVGLFTASGSFGILMQSIIYIFKYNLEMPGAAKLAFTAIALASLTAVPVWMVVVRRTGNRFVWVCGTGLAATALTILWLTPLSVWQVTVLVYLAAAGINGFLMTFLPMVADCVDYGEVESGVRVEALTFGMMSLANKLSIGCAGWLLGFLQTRVGFVPNAAQSEETLAGLVAILALTPAAGFLFSALVLTRYRLTSEYHGRLIEQLAVRRG